MTRHAVILRRRSYAGVEASVFPLAFDDPSDPVVRAAGLTSPPGEPPHVSTRAAIFHGTFEDCGRWASSEGLTIVAAEHEAWDSADMYCQQIRWSRAVDEFERTLARSAADDLASLRSMADEVGRVHREHRLAWDHQEAEQIVAYAHRMAAAAEDDESRDWWLDMAEIAEAKLVAKPDWRPLWWQFREEEL